MSKGLKQLSMAFGLAVILFSCAAMLGWHDYRMHPEGMLLHTPQGPCPRLAHSFAVGLFLGLVLAGIACALAALACLGASFVPAWRRAKSALRAVTVVLLAVLPLLLLFGLTSPLIESRLPQKKRTCEEPLPALRHAPAQGAAPTLPDFTQATRPPGTKSAH
ncbi:MAG: hypothetical protein Q8K91_01070 [Hylemonella sp.]|nr:hypothetical protein [Hylemonella sp.]